MMTEPMTEPMPTKAVVERTHIVDIVNDQARCTDCDWVSPDYGREGHNPNYCRFLAEIAREEHKRAISNWPGTS